MISCKQDGPFLRDLQALGQTVVTILRTDQYEGLQSFTEVGMFIPLERDRHRQLVREADPAFFALPLPDQKGPFLPFRAPLVQAECSLEGYLHIPVGPTSAEVMALGLVTWTPPGSG